VSTENVEERCMVPVVLEALQTSVAVENGR